MGADVLTVGVVEDHPLYRDSLVREVDGQPDMRVAVVCASVEEFGELVREPPPAVVLLDLNLPGVRGADGVRRVAARGSAVLVVSALAGADEVLAAVEAGARGYLTKRADGAEITGAVRTVAGGGSYVSPVLAGYLLDGRRAATALSAREREILGLLAAGETNQGIAEQLHISAFTVRSHLDRIREKTGRRRRPDLTRLAVEQGLVPLPERGDADPPAR